MSSYCILLHYWPATPFLAPLAAGSDLVLESCDHFQKKSGRNRFTVLSSYGPVMLSVPLEKGKHQQLPYRDVRISWSEPWNRRHWRTIRSCYGRAPFFDHFADELEALYHTRDTFLWDWNLRLLTWLLQQLQLPDTPLLTSQWNPELHVDNVDFRMDSHTEERPWPAWIQPVSYPQAFDDRLGFTAGLSTLDLLFCAGPQARMILRDMVTGDPLKPDNSTR